MENTTHNPTLPPTHHNPNTPPTTATYSTTQDNVPPKLPSFPHTSRNPRHRPPLLQRHAIRAKRYDQRTSHGVPPRSNSCTWPIGNRQMPNTRTSTRHQHTYMANHASHTHHTNTKTGNPHRTHTTPKHRPHPTHSPQPQKHNEHIT